MKKIIYSFFLIACVVSLSQCRMRTQGFDTYFWTSTDKAEECHLFIDDIDRGVIPYLAHPPRCGSKTLKRKALFIPLPSGNYEIKVRDREGEIRYAERFKIRRSFGSATISSSNSGWENAGARSVREGDCLIREIYY